MLSDNGCKWRQKSLQLSDNSFHETKRYKKILNGLASYDAYVIFSLAMPDPILAVLIH